MMSFLPAFLLDMPNQRAKVDIHNFVDLLPKMYAILGPDKEVDRIATDSAKLVSAYNKLKFSHESELPNVIDQVKQHIMDLKTVMSKSDKT